ncbi:SDR family oxidoreductase [Nodularia harveyana UHCC-0300]|uniref:SDR family oxidoreductase n=1 Tax=Nodularia harveyana UHCC-0300 TaxID=2974287 RepID=A0ABU5UHY8_9CYAN|nr:SDR family oxidoreductase [Nodularia harveyana]MEA5583124.1 SDR family oxidoreductase [Nodularia harveyana UHCC-0300]
MSAVTASVEDLVLIAGATGGVGQLVTANLLGKGMKVRILTRNAAKARKMFPEPVEIVVGDIRDISTLPPAIQDINYIICCTGTTAFPSERWEFDPPPNFLEWGRILIDSEYRNTKAQNNPQKVDAEGVRNLISVTPPHLKRCVFVSSVGVHRKNQPPFNILNAFGVLDAKEKGEQAIINSGIPYTIIRPGRLIDGPYTSYDLNTLLKAKTGGKQGVVVETGDNLSGDASRIDVAAACVESLFYPSTANQAFTLVNKGTRPPVISWETIFSQLR